MGESTVDREEINLDLLAIVIKQQVGNLREKSKGYPK
jgi:hypothetical protein